MSTSAAAFDLLAPGVQKALWGMKWNELNDLQQQAIPKVLHSDRHLILSAATASGKTEAAFLPILSAIACEQSSGLSVIYVGPLKALINDQFQRLETLCEHLDVPVHRWHGDVPADAKKKFIDHPRGVLLITPESLESIFVNRTPHLARLFGILRFVVVDELHAFLDNARGRHLRSLLDRVSFFVSFRTVGLSATIGEPDVARTWIDRRNPERVELVTGDNLQGQLLCKLHAYQIDAHRVHTDGEDDEPQPEIIRLANDIVARHCGKSNLVFCNAKSQVEELADRVARIAESQRRPDHILVHHGSLSADVRVEAEEVMKSGAVATTFCSSTLEMGIDIGHVEAVGQVGPPFSVASLKQRVGRSGRKPGSPRVLRVYLECETLDGQSPLIDRMQVNLVQSIAMMDLMLEGWVESPRPAACDLSTLTQQVISVIVESGGVDAAGLHTVLCANGAFAGIQPKLFAELLRSLASHDVIEQTRDGSLILGLRGEAVRKDKGFYAVFPTPDEFAVLHDGRTIGKLGYLPGEHQIGSRFILARKRWQITEVDADGKVVYVAPSRTRKPPLFATSDAADLDDVVVERMRQTLVSEVAPSYIDGVAQAVLASARTAARAAGVLDRGLVAVNPTSTAIMLWSGTRVNDTLIAYLETHGIKTESWGIGVVALADRASVELALSQFLKLPPMADAIVAKYPPPSPRKYDRFLTERLLTECRMRDGIDIPGCLAALSKLPLNEPALRDVAKKPLIAVIDVETTGLFPQKHDRIVEIAVVVMTPDGTIVREFETLVNPDRDIGPTRIHGLTAGDVATAPSFADVLPALLAVLDGAVAIAGHNVRFDQTFLAAECGRTGLSLPEVHALCTLRLAGGGKLAACCTDYGVAFDREAHHALNDARAAAGLLACLLREEPRLVRSLAARPAIGWPTTTAIAKPPVTRRERRVERDAAPVYLSRLANVRGRVNAPPDDTAKAAYLDVLDRVLEDRRLDDAEMESLLALAVNFGLVHGDVMACHREYLAQLAKLALADHVVTEAERTDLSAVARLLGLPSTAVEESLMAISEPQRELATREDMLGQRVCFTGELLSTYQGRAVTRDVAESLAAQAGLIIADSVTKKLDLLVVADPDSLSGKAKKARQYGIRIMHEAVFWRLIGVAPG